MIERHVRELEKEGHGVTYLRTNLETDAVQLTYRDPNYLGAKAGNGYVKDEVYRNIKDYNMKSMLLIIVNKSGFEADLNEIYTRRNPRKRIEDIEPYDIMTDLDNTIEIHESRITQNEGNQIYQLKRNNKKQNMLPSSTQRNPTQSAIDKISRDMEELKSSMNKARKPRIEDQIRASNQKMYSQLEIEQPHGKKTGPSTTYEYPCKECKHIPGTTKLEQQDICRNSFHCKFHGGQYMCTLAPQCKLRTEKIAVLNQLKKKRRSKAAMPQREKMSARKRHRKSYESRNRRAERETGRMHMGRRHSIARRIQCKPVRMDSPAKTKHIR